MCGMHGSYTANMALQNADCIINIGARFDDRIIGNKNEYAPNAKHIIHCNLELSEFNKNIYTNYPVECDSQYFIQQIIPIFKNKL